MGSYSFSNIARRLIREKTGTLMSCYCREDAAAARRRLLEAPADGALFRREDLRDICRALLGGPGPGESPADYALRLDRYLEDLLADESRLAEIPTRQELQDRMLEVLYAAYGASPSPAGYMERLVRRLAPEYGADPVRVAILKKFFLGAGLRSRTFPTQAIARWCEGRMTEAERSALRRADPAERPALLAAQLDETLFAEKLETPLTHRELLALMVTWMDRWAGDSSLDWTPPDLSPEDREALAAACRARGLAAGGEDDPAALMAFLADSPSEAPLPEEVFRAVEGAFLARARSVTRTGRTGKVTPVYGQYETACRDARRKKEKDWALLGLCDDLAAGKFRGNGKTRLHLYYFALMFGMTVAAGADETPDPATDVAKNLFQDYYNDNLVRFLEAPYREANWANLYEKEPTGEGINYKNYAEAVFLYFLCRTDLDLTPGERIDRAGDILVRCRRLAEEAPPERPAGNWDLTARYEDLLDLLLERSPDQLPAFLAEHYQIISPENPGAARITVQWEENTAFLGLEDLMLALDEAGTEEDFVLPDGEDGREEWDEEQDYLRNAAFSSRLPALLRERYRDDPAFLRVVDALEDRLRDGTRRFSRLQREQLLAVLRLLYHRTGETRTISMDQLRKDMEAWGYHVDVPWLTAALKQWKKLGADIRREEKRVSLGDRTPAEGDLGRLLDFVKASRYDRRDRDQEARLLRLLLAAQWPDRRITRSQLLAAHLNYYIYACLFDPREEGDRADPPEDFPSFPALLADYRQSADEYLREARYQTLSEKNVLDVYIILSLYFYVMDSAAQREA